MQNIKTRTKSIMNGAITINMERLEYNMAIVTYAILYFVNKLLIFAAVIFGLGVAMAGGDGKYCDGNFAASIVCLIACVACGFSARIISVLMDNLINKVKIRKKH